MAQKIIDEDQARSLAAAEIEEHFKPYGFTLTKVEPKPYGWVFYYAPLSYIKIKDPSSLFPGMGPIVVTRAGDLHKLGSLPHALERFENQQNGLN